MDNEYYIVANEKHSTLANLFQSSSSNLKIEQFDVYQPFIYEFQASDYVVEQRKDDDIETPSIFKEDHMNFNFFDQSSQQLFEEEPELGKQNLVTGIETYCLNWESKSGKDQQLNLSGISKLKIKKNLQKKCAETKNLPSFFLRLFFKVVDQANLSSDERKKYISFENSDTMSKPSIKKLRDFIQVPSFRKLIISYIESYQYLDDVLSSDKIMNVATPIKYLMHIHRACQHPEEFRNWAD